MPRHDQSSPRAEERSARRTQARRQDAACAKLSQRIHAQLGKQGRLQVRWSGSESKLRVMLEGPALSRLELFAEELAEAAQKDLCAVN